MPVSRTGLAVAFACLFAAGQAQAQAQGSRATVGVAFGGGSARGLAHIGVIQWFEEHRIPIDVAAGTSMGAGGRRVRVRRSPGTL